MGAGSAALMIKKTFAALSCSISLLSPSIDFEGGPLGTVSNPIAPAKSQSISSMKAPPLGTCVTESNPTSTVQFCRQLGLVEGRLRSCQSSENCLSTSSKSASQYAPPWMYGLSSSTSSSSSTTSSSTPLNEIDAFNVIKVAAQRQGLKVLKSDESNLYILAAEKGETPKFPAGSSLFYEFLIKPADKLVLYRGVVDKTVFLYPLQQPVGDFGILREKFNAIQRETGFLSVGTE